MTKLVDLVRLKQQLKRRYEKGESLSSLYRDIRERYSGVGEITLLQTLVNGAIDSQRRVNRRKLNYCFREAERIGFSNPEPCFTEFKRKTRRRLEDQE